MSTQRRKIVVSEFMDSSAVESLRKHFDVLDDRTLVDDPKRLFEAVHDADAIVIRNRTQINPALLERAPRLSVVGRLGVGLDNIDLKACEQRQVKIIPATGANALAVAEYVISTAMMLLRGAYLSSAEVASGDWPRPQLSNGREFAGSTLAVVGFGGVGQLVARLAIGLGVQVIAFDPQLAGDAEVWQLSGVRRVSFEEALAQADVLTLHVPLRDETRNLLGPVQIKSLKPHAVVINAARGGIIDEAALATALREGRVGGAALDVFEEEPMRDGSMFAGLPNVILTPHIAGLTLQSNERVSTLIAARVTEALSQGGC
ncbi:hydroxyacid dehydrogenase [Paraburkholderia elongata]|uniref:3-phosphoglycerate dehydrogenase n=1 Tax=Paraburkholderia elongata TaxID=2675747 RepID=A0A972NSM7_9BURK|nr:hydroxyacid dehydrogenase [Paraburkholderia elongata]NPT58237.1 3-phosphoglycerate dehydrogenase [Paraburkholderia elongata]